LLWALTAGAEIGDDSWLRQLIAAAGLLGTPLALAGAVIALRVARADRGGDRLERLVAVATAGLRNGRGEWGAAMRAELTSIDDPPERRRFAIGCLVAALRTGIGRAPWIVALAVGLVFPIGTFAASRVSLAGGRGGIMGFTIAWPPLILFVAALFTALATRSFRTALVTGGLALVAGLVGMLAVASAEAAHWHAVAGVFLMDGDAPKESLDRVEAMLDPVSPVFVLLNLLVWAPWAVIGAAAGSWRHRHAHGVPPATS
jgi:hypothetical protein